MPEQIAMTLQQRIEVAASLAEQALCKLEDELDT